MELLAKSNEAETLIKHIEDVLKISELLKEAFPYVRLLTNDEFLFWEHLRSALIFHDLGKSHVEFQKTLRGVSNSWHFQRHELFSLPFLNAFDNRNDYIYYAVAGHHKTIEKLMELSARYETQDLFGLNVEGLSSQMSFDSEFEKVLVDKVIQILQSFSIQLNSLKNENPKIKLSQFSDFVSDKERRMKLLLLSGAFKHCDHLASAGFSDLRVLENQDFDFLNNTNYELYKHQQDARHTIGHSILTAPTGSGKTETSLFWLQNQIKNRGTGRVFYILPFTASINAMYLRLNKDIPDKIGMLHGKLEAFLDRQFTDDDIEAGKIKQVKEQFRNLTMPLKVVTPFQLLKNLFSIKGYEKGLFEWAGGYFIFDEIHAYNPSVFAQIIVLIEFAIKRFGVQVFVMTATLPSYLRKEVERALGGHQPIYASQNLYENFVRHRVTVKEGDILENVNLIQSYLDKPKTKVLVVCNTVQQAQEVYKNLKSKCKVLLHSSFNADRRSNKELQLFKEETLLLVGTQAIEVSLDIDYDVIFTEPAPLDALIQRFGRINRRRKKGICDCFVFENRNKVDKFIYKDQDVINRTLSILKQNQVQNNGVIAEGRLQEMIDFVYPDWSKNDKDEFDNLYETLFHLVNEELKPFTENKKSEEDFYNQFDGIKVLPIKFFSQYEKLLNENKFIKAENLKVQINEKRFMIFNAQQNMELERSVFTMKKSMKIKEQTTWVLNKKYDEDLGLLIDEDETNIDISKQVDF